MPQPFLSFWTAASSVSLRVGVGLKLQRRSNEQAPVVDVVDACFAIARQPGEAIRPDAGFVELAAHVELALVGVEAAGPDLDLLKILVGGALADVVDDAAGAVLAVQHRAWPAQDLDPFGPIRIERQE